MPTIVCIGDALKFGGQVMQGSTTRLAHGRGAARKTDAVTCARHGINRIAEGEPRIVVDGLPVALDGHRCECGCALIASITRVRVG